MTKPARITKRMINRPSPACVAGSCPGRTKKGNDGTMWISKKIANDQYRWFRKSVPTKQRYTFHGKGSTYTLTDMGRKMAEKDKGPTSRLMQRLPKKRHFTREEFHEAVDNQTKAYKDRLLGMLHDQKLITRHRSSAEKMASRGYSF